MKKSLLAVAVAAALPAFAYAQTNVVLSGNVKTGITQTKYSNGAANNGNHTAMNDGSSRFVISGTEDLGGGLKAIFQIDNRFRPDDGGTQSLAGGATFVGLAGGFGTLRLGKLDTYYIYGLDEHGVRATALQHSNTSILGYVNGSLGTATVGAPGSTATIARNSRLNNVIRWDSPNFGGISGGLTYTPGATGGASAGEGPGMGDAQKGQAWSANIGYAAGPLNVGAALFDEKVEGYKLAAPGGFEGAKAWRGFRGYNFGMFKLGLVYDEAKIVLNGGDVKRGAWSVPVTAQLGAGTLLFTYSQALDAKYNGSKNSNTGAKMFVLGYDYPLSKRTSVGVSYAVLNNDSSAAYGLYTGAALNNLVSPTAGQDQKQLHLGVRHAF